MQSFSICMLLHEAYQCELILMNVELFAEIDLDIKNTSTSIEKPNHNKMFKIVVWYALIISRINIKQYLVFITASNHWCFNYKILNYRIVVEVK